MVHKLTPRTLAEVVRVTCGDAAQIRRTTTPFIGGGGGAAVLGSSTRGAGNGLSFRTEKSRGGAGPFFDLWCAGTARPRQVIHSRNKSFPVYRERDRIDCCTFARLAEWNVYGAFLP